MMCKVFCKQFLGQMTYRNNCTKQRCLYHALHTVSKSLGYRTTYTQLRYLANATVASQVTSTEIKYFLKDKGFKFDEGYACLHLPCPLCTIGENRKPDTTMYINKITGTFICYSCKHTGNWQLFQRYASLLRTDDYKRLKFPKEEKAIFLTEEEEQELQKMLHSSCNISDLTEKEVLTLSKEFDIEGLDSNCLKNFDVKVTQDHNHLLLPIYGYDCKVAGIHMLSLPEASDHSHHCSVFPRKKIAALFGGSKASNSKEIVLTSSPVDAMAVSQQASVPGICIPQSIPSLTEEVLPLMENFKKIIIWFGNSTQEETAAITFAKTMGENRCHLVHSWKDHITPLSCLQNNENIANILKKAQPFVHHSIIMPRSLREKVLARIYNKEETMGVKWKRFPALNLLLKGLRPGELTIFTGPTGSGKTTFISEYSLDVCMQGVCTLWGSFEINNERLLKIMLTQFAQIPLEKHKDKCDFWADKFEQLPLYLMTFHGEASLPNVIDVMTYAVHFYNVQHVVIDNVQFMLGTGDMSSSLDRFWQQDKLISAFRKFATHHNCHVTLVMHPRKERESEELNNYSIFGGAKASQEADNILILQDKKASTVRGRKYLQLTKNRFDGDLGIMSLEFDKETLSFAMKKKPKKASKNSKTSREADSSSESKVSNEQDNDAS